MDDGDGSAGNRGRRGGGPARGGGAAGEQAKPGGSPTFRIDANYPQEFPNHWVMGSITGVFVDGRDHVWIAHLPETLTEEELYEEQSPPMGICCKAAPTVIELDATGKVVQGWGEKAKDNPANWPRNPHGTFVDHTDHVWLGSHMPCEPGGGAWNPAGGSRSDNGRSVNHPPSVGWCRLSSSVMCSGRAAVFAVLALARIAAV